jgi:hypothetical protein
MAWHITTPLHQIDREHFAGLDGYAYNGFVADPEAEMTENNEHRIPLGFDLRPREERGA